MPNNVPGIGFDPYTFAAAPAASASPLQVNNMQGSNGQSQGDEVSKSNEATKEIKGGVDWIEGTFTLQIQDWDQLREVLETGREEAKARKSEKLITLADQYGRIAPHGVGPGYRHYRYFVKLNGMTLCFADIPAGDPERPNVKFIITGGQLLEHGFRECLNRMHLIFKAFNAITIDSCVSRVDVCADVQGLSMETVARAYMNGQFIKRADKASAHWGNKGFEDWQTLDLGAPKADLKVRFYNKLQELSDQPDDKKLGLMKELRWGGKMPKQCTRIEFQLRRKRLADDTLRIYTVEDLCHRLGFLVQYLTRKWIRVASDPVDRDNDNQNRADTCDWWENVQNHFDEWAADFQAGFVEPKPKAQASADRMMRQAVGCLKRAYAQLGQIPANASDAVSGLLEMISGDYAGFLDSVCTKMDDLSKHTEEVAQLLAQRSRPEFEIPASSDEDPQYSRYDQIGSVIDRWLSGESGNGHHQSIERLKQRGLGFDG